jgi:predicted nucleic acid-binding protein
MVLMYLLDTNVISEIRKGKGADTGVQIFFGDVISNNITTYLTVITIGEIRRGIENIRYRKDIKQAEMLEFWLGKVLTEYSDHILTFDMEAAQVWGYLRVPHHEHLLDKQIAAIALVHDLTVVTRNINDFSSTGVKLFDPFAG